jgi:hypothetical protein
MLTTPIQALILHSQSAVFCLAPRGFAPWSRRLFDFIVLGCIPVIIADEADHPFEHRVAYEDFSIRIREADIPRVKSILLKVSRVERARLRAGLRTVRQLFSYAALPLGPNNRPAPSMFASSTHSNGDDAFTATIRQLGAQGPRRVVKSPRIDSPDLQRTRALSAAHSLDHEDADDDRGFHHLASDQN